MTGGASNFDFLEKREPLLFKLGALSEGYFTEDPNTAQIKLRQFAELLAQLSAAHFGIEVSAHDAQVDILRRLKLECGIPREVSDLFHTLRVSGNQAVHEIKGDHASALAGLKIARQLSIWFVRTFYEPGLKFGPFAPPQPPHDSSADVVDEIQALRRELATVRGLAAEPLGVLWAALANRLPNKHHRHSPACPVGGGCGNSNT